MSPHALANNRHRNIPCGGSTGNNRTLIRYSSGTEMTKQMSDAFRKVVVYVASSTTTMNNSNNDDDTNERNDQNN